MKRVFVENKSKQLPPSSYLDDVRVCLYVCVDTKISILALLLVVDSPSPGQVTLTQQLLCSQKVCGQSV